MGMSDEIAREVVIISEMLISSVKEGGLLLRMFEDLPEMLLSTCIMVNYF